MPETLEEFGLDCLQDPQGAAIDDDASTTGVSSCLPTRNEWTALVALCGAALGTGGLATVAVAEDVSVAQSSSPLVAPAPAKRRRRAALATVSEKLFGVRQHFSLNISELAAVLRVQRPALYAWIQGRSEPQRHNMQRIDEVYELALDWRQMSVEPAGELARSRFNGDVSFLEALREPHLDAARIHGMLLGMRQRAAEREAHDRNSMITDPAADKGYAPVPNELQRENFEYGTEW